MTSIYPLNRSRTGDEEVGMSSSAEKVEIKLPSETLRLLRRQARAQKLSLAQVVNKAVDKMLREDRQSRICAAKALFKVGALVADWPEIKREIEEARSPRDRR
jgi:4'-phosphopantetheinyl transferase EntD